MEHVINAKFRNHAFWKFMIFFIITILTVVTAVYFDYDVPSKENALQREKIKDYEMQFYSQQEFIANMKAAKTLIDSMIKGGEYDILMVNKIGKHFETLQDQKYIDSNIYAAMNKEAFIVLDEYRNLSANYINSKDAKQRADSLAIEAEKWRTKYDELQRTLDILRRGNNSNF